MRLTLQPVIIISSRARRKKNHKCQTLVKVTLWKGQWANQGYPISNNPQTFRNAVAADWPEAAVMWPFDPLQLFEEAITWRVTSSRLTKEETGGKRSRAGGSMNSESCFISWSLQTKNLQLWQICSFFVNIPVSVSPCSHFSNVVSLFTPGRAFYSHRGLDSRSVTQWGTEEPVEVKRKNKTLLKKTATGHVLWQSGLMVFFVVDLLFTAASRRVINYMKNLNKWVEECTECRELTEWFDEDGKNVNQKLRLWRRFMFILFSFVTRLYNWPNTDKKQSDMCWAATVRFDWTKYF